MNKIALVLAAAVTCAAALAGNATRTATLSVSNMSCAACPITVRKTLEKVPGLDKARVDFETKQAVIAFDPARTSAEALLQATAAAGFPATIKQVQ